ncbi:unnamed protein product [Linum trigynum]|uniref:C2H2-type domain-containing protein n=1 Tax=Linum trigynum TaxID=586398 RepID=A0AAV2GP92_9ROSI
MAKQQQASSDSSSDDEQPGNDGHVDATVLAPKAVVKRSYECSFCKRGFTNAQALGGHMNIHRRDRAKSTKPSSASADPAAAFSKQQRIIYDSPSVWEAHGHVFFQNPGSGGAGGGHGNMIISNSDIGRPSSSHVEAHGYELVIPPAHGSGHHGPAEDVRWGANLSLRVGSGQKQEGGEEEEEEEEEQEQVLSKRPIWNGSSSTSDQDNLDLELRLGHQ